MKYYMRLAWAYIRIATKKTMVYRGSFVINCIAQGLAYATTFLTMWIMVQAFGNLGGWSSYEVMLLYAMSLISYGLAGTFFLSMMGQIPDDIHHGRFDDTMLKPTAPLFTLAMSGFIWNYLAHFTLATIIIVLCFTNLGIVMGVLEILRFIIVLIAGGFLYAGMFILIGTPAFFIKKVDALSDFLFFFREVSNYPVSIFPKFIQAIMVFVLPFAMVNFLPVQSFIHKQDLLMFGPAIQYIAPAISVDFFVLAVILFNVSTRFYKSAGS